MNARSLLEQAFAAGVTAASPRRCLPSRLPQDSPAGKTIVLAAGKAAAEMAAVAEETLCGDVTGLAVTRYGYATPQPLKRIRLIEAGHPTPDKNSRRAADEMMMIAQRARAEDRVIFLMSGGGSALLCAPIDGVTLAEKSALTKSLVLSGAPISDINFVRAHFSKVKGGRLAALARKAQLFTYVISDVVGDDPALVASGPSIAQQFDPARARTMLAQYRIDIPEPMARALERAMAPARADHPAEVVASSRNALDAAGALLKRKGYEVLRLGDALEGEASVIGARHAEEAMRARRSGGKVALISGGELTVTVRNANGRGGPNLEYLAGLMVKLNGVPNIFALAGDTDGVDGSEDNAGGYVDANSLAACHATGVDPAALLCRNCSYDVFAATGGLLVTGPTRTNVNDLRIILVNGDG